MTFDFNKLRSLTDNAEVSAPVSDAPAARAVYDPGDDLFKSLQAANLEKAAAAKRRREITYEVIALKNLLRIPDKTEYDLQNIAVISLRIASKALNDADLYSCSKDALKIDNEAIERVLSEYAPVSEPVCLVNVTKPALKVTARKKSGESEAEFEERRSVILAEAESKRDYILLHGLTESPNLAQTAVLTAVSLFNEKEPVYFGETLKTLLNEKFEYVDPVEFLKDCVVSGVEKRTSYPAGSDAQTIYVDMITSKVFEKFPDLVIAARQKAFELEDTV